MSDFALSRDDLVALFDALAAAAIRRGVRIEVFVVGGAAITLAYNTQCTTTDVDGVFEPKEVAYQLAAEVAAERGLRPDWLNDGAKAYMPGDDPDKVVFYDNEGLVLRVASPRYLFVMKALAARESDEDDLRLLYSLNQFRSANEALDAVIEAYPGWLMKPNVQYMIEQIAAQRDEAGEEPRSR